MIPLEGPAALFGLSGRRALVTGGTGGLGRAIVRAFAGAGAEVLVSDRDAAACATLAGDVNAAGGRALPLPCDLADAGSRAALCAAAGDIDILVCNAGMQGPAGPSANVTDDDFDQVMGLNLRAATDLTARLVPAMADRGHGRVILMASIAGLRGNRAIGLYAMSKAALAQHARNLAVEWGPYGVCANAIAPGLIATPFAESLMRDAAFMTRRLAATPLRRVGTDAEVAGAALFLASSAGGFVTGQVLVVDGGTVISDGS